RAQRLGRSVARSAEARLGCCRAGVARSLLANCAEEVGGSGLRSLNQLPRATDERRAESLGYSIVNRLQRGKILLAGIRQSAQIYEQAHLHPHRLLVARFRDSLLEGSTRGGEVPSADIDARPEQVVVHEENALAEALAELAGLVELSLRAVPIAREHQRFDGVTEHFRAARDHAGAPVELEAFADQT